MARVTALNRLMDEMTTLMLAEHDAETRFRLCAAGRQQRALELLDQAAQGADQSSGG